LPDTQDRGALAIAKPPPIELSKRQKEILTLIANGKSNAKIAQELDLSTHTVDAYCRRILLKFNTRSRVTAAVRASQLGLIPLVQ